MRYQSRARPPLAKQRFRGWLLCVDRQTAITNKELTRQQCGGVQIDACPCSHSRTRLCRKPVSEVAILTGRPFISS